MKIRPLTISQANELIATLHRHHKPVQGHRFSLGAYEGDRLVGAAVVGRPVSRELDPNRVAEVTRLVTDGTKNACSFLYSACARIAKEMGFDKIQTYILESETGASLVASGWAFETNTHPGTWNCNARKGRREDQPMVAKQRWAKVFQCDYHSWIVFGAQNDHMCCTKCQKVRPMTEGDRLAMEH